jgi:hypothetical protein
MPPIEVSVMPSAPEPLNLPRPLAAMTVPLTLVPLANTTLPREVMGLLSTPVKPSPTSFLLAARVWVIETRTTVPLGAVKTGGATGAAGAGGGVAVAAGVAPGELLAGAGAVATGVPSELTAPGAGGVGAAAGDPLELAASGAGGGVLLHPPRLNTPVASVNAISVLRVFDFIVKSHFPDWYLKLVRHRFDLIRCPSDSFRQPSECPDYSGLSWYIYNRRNTTFGLLYCVSSRSAKNSDSCVSLLSSQGMRRRTTTFVRLIKTFVQFIKVVEMLQLTTWAPSTYFEGMK